MESLVRRLVRCFSRKQNGLESGGRTGWKTDRLQEALDRWVAAKGYRKPHRTLYETAKDLGVDGLLLHHYFKDSLHVDFRTWRTRLRLEDACRLLLEEPGTCAADIGLRVGFSNRSNFARQFRAHLGCTPGEWRRKSPEMLLSLHD